MNLIHRVGVGLVSVTGVSTAVGVPVALDVKSRTIRSVNNFSGGALFRYL